MSSRRYDSSIQYIPIHCLLNSMSLLLIQGGNDVIAGGTREEQRDAPMLNANRKSGKINYEFARVRRAITGEKVGSLMGVIEDIPMFCFNAYLIFHKDIDESMLMISVCFYFRFFHY